MVTSTPFGSSGDVFTWISGFINFERGQKLKNFGLDRIKYLTDLAGNPEKYAPSFHVAGSKGKGSVTGMIASILEASGRKTALYASPHVIDFRERLCLASSFFEEEIYIRGGIELKQIVNDFNNSSFSKSHGEEASFFELITLWFFLCARLANCDAMSVETGLGGRLDATNILDPLVSVITLIELEHTEILGTTIPAIAGEKAGIIKQGKPLVLARQKPEALNVFRDHAAAKNSELFYFPDNAGVEDLSVSLKGTSFSLAFKKNSPWGNTKINDLFISIPGEVQAYNAGLAALAIKTAYPDLSSDMLREGLAKFKIPARFEKISEKPHVIIDGAHTKESMDLCVKTFTALYGNGNILIFGCAAGKDVHAMAKLCLPCFSRIIITTPGTFKVSHPDELFGIFKAIKQEINCKTEVLFIPETEKAIDLALNLGVNNSLSILGAGSFYLSAEIRNAIVKTARK